jgi:hypothetical protein
MCTTDCSTTAPGRCMDFASDGPLEIARAIADEIGRTTDCLPVETDGAARAAR